MNNNYLLHTSLFIYVFTTGLSFGLSAQEIAINYTTELQYNLNTQVNWVNLLDINAMVTTEQLHLWKNGEFNYASISILKTSKERIANDLQTFSNIEEDNLIYAPSILGYTQTVHNVRLFGGLRNVNADYFTAPYTSLFTNSSCGIYATLSSNYPLANYPLSAMCLHMEYQPDSHWLIKSSLYNGIAYEPYRKGNSIFTIRPGKDGIFNMTEINYTQNSTYYGSYHLGSAIHSGMPVEANFTQWGSIEQCIYNSKEREIGLLAQYSYTPSLHNTCRQYYGVGLLFKGWLTEARNDQLGIFINRAKFGANNETAAELTWKYPINTYLDIQPAFHFIVNKEASYAIGLVRLSFTIPITQ